MVSGLLDSLSLRFTALDLSFQHVLVYRYLTISL